MTVFSRIALAALLRTSFSTTTLVHAHSHSVSLDLKFEEEDHVLPMPLSDMSATYDAATNRIYIVGGCDDPQGNAKQDWGGYACTSLTSKTYAYDPDEGTFATMEDAPRDRYRHTAANVNGKIWLVGGRTVEDHLIKEIDVFDPVAKTWSTVGSLPPRLQMSDQASFSFGETLYVLGGYDANYTATNEMYSVDANESHLAEHGVVFRDGPSLAAARGDVHAATVGESAAYVVGGYTHADEWCVPLVSTERYDVDADAWTTVGNLATGRADKALVAVNDRLYAVGGEAKHTCSGDPSEYTKALDDVEVLLDADETDRNDHEWTVVADVPTRRFRFVGAPWPNTDSVYILGGQTFYEPSCQCFATSDIISKYTEKTKDKEEDNAESVASSLTFVHSVVASVLVSGFAVFGVF